MEPSYAVKCLVPVDIARLCQRNRGIRAVVDDLTGKLVRTGFEIINPHSSVPVDDFFRIYAEIAQLADAGIGNVVFRQNGQEFRVHAVVCKADSDICFASAERRLQHRRLEEALMTGCFQAEHDFSECQDLHPRTSFTISLASRQSAVIASKLPTAISFFGHSQLPPTA